MSDPDLSQRIHDFWFGEEGGEVFGTSRVEWFKKDEAFDEAIRAAFLDDVEAAIAGERDVLGDRSAHDCLALLILLDQFPRNLFRGQAKAFSGDERARKLVDHAIDKGFDIQTPLLQRLFFYLPLEHSENLADQNRCVDFIAALNSGDLLQYAHAHRDIIARFGRFPHRNASLGRNSTAEELAFLETPDSSF